MNEFLAKQLTIRAFNNFKRTKTSASSGGCAIYDYLIAKGIMKRDAEQIKEAMQYSLEHFRNVYENHPDSELKKTGSVINRAKALCVDNFFTDLKMNNKKIEEYL